MNSFVLPVFPPSSLDSSVTTTVFVGLLVLAFFNLRLGWVASGFIVPGYLVPLIILKPWSALIIILEGILSYLIVWFLSERLSRWDFWSPFFGRDRFFMLLLVSILVRTVCDGLLLPKLGVYLNNTWHIAFDYRNNLHSFGLIISSLIANQFWKPGFFRGSIPFFTTLVITWILVRFGLMEFTNFTISSIGYLYEDLASDILASPKAYIILLTTAYIASRMNLKYGWEFSGILIPSLMTLLWYNPLKIVTTLFEAVLVSLLAVLLLRLPAFRSITMEGTRKLVFFFVVSYCYKYLLAWLLVWKFPAYQPSDAYGFGYLLPTLLAIKMQEIHSYGKTTRFVLQTSLASILVASIIGFSLTFVPDFLTTQAKRGVNGTAVQEEPTQGSLMDRVRADKLLIYYSRLPGVPTPPLARDADLFVRGIRHLLDSIDTRRPELREEALRLLAQVGYRAVMVEGRYIYLKETESQMRGWGLFIIDTRSSSRLLVGVPAPLTESGTLEAGIALFVSQQARALAVAGAESSTEKAITGSRTSSLFHKFCQAVSNNNQLHLRGYTLESVRMIAGLRPEEGSISAPIIDSSLWIKETLPAGLNLKQLRDSLKSLKLEWRSPPISSDERNTARKGFAELLVNMDDMRSITFKPLLASYSAFEALQRTRIDGYLQDWLFSRKEAIAERGSNSYLKPKLEELLLFDAEVLTPLLRLSTHEGKYRKAERHDSELRFVQAAAALFGYGITVYRHIPSGQEYYILAERDDRATRRFWGTYVFRIGPSSGYIIQVPRPLYELNSFEYGVTLFERLSAKALLIGGSHPDTNQDGSADLVSPTNKENLFNLVNQVILREIPNPMLVIQSRAFGLSPETPAPDASILLAFGNGAITRQELPRLGLPLMDILEEDRLKIRFVDGSRDVVGYEVGGLSQAQYLNATKNKDLVILWLSPAARASYRQQQENRRLDAQFRAVGISSLEGDLYSVLSGLKLGQSGIRPELKQQLVSYLATLDMVVLHRLINNWPEYRYRRVIDINSRQAFLLVIHQNRLVAVLNPAPRKPDEILTLKRPVLARDDINRFVDSRYAIFEFGSSR